MDRFFHVTEKGSTVRTEIMAGITTFMAMAYILMVNAGMFSNPFGDGTDVLGVSYGAIYVATAISAVVGTLLIGLLSNLPLAQASGMGLNAYFVYTVCVGLGLSYANALVLVLFDGIIFVLLTVTGLRKIIFDSIPHEVKAAISAGIGLFIAFIGLQNAGIVVNDSSTCVNLHSFNVFTGEQTWATIFPMLVTLLAVFAIGAMSKKKVRGAVLWGILGAAVVYYVVGLITVPGFYASAIAPNLTSDFFGAFRDFGTQAFGAVFKSGFDFSAFIAANGTGAFVVMLLTTMLAFCMVGLSYANALVLVLFDGIIFVLLTVTGLRKIIFDSIPHEVKAAISAGIGLFIAFIGLQNAGIVVNDSSTCVNLHSFNVFTGEQTWATIFPMLVTLLAVFAIGAMSKKKVRGAVLWGILGAAVVYYVVGLITVPGFYASAIAPNLTSDFFGAFRDFGTQAFGAVFKSGFDFSAFIAANGTGAFVVMLLTTMLAFCMVDMFDTLGTLYGACSAGNMLDKDGNVPNMDRAMLADACATCAGAVCGTSTVTTFVESSAGVAEGGRTGLASMATAVMFFIAMFLSPVAQLIPTYACAAALIYVGVLMMSNVRNIAWDDPAAAVTGFVTVAFMPLTYNISYGIAFGLISYVFVKIFTGKIKEINVGTWIISILFALMFFLTR